jgi:hypothetical protein
MYVCEKGGSSNLYCLCSSQFCTEFFGYKLGALLAKEQQDI